MARTNEEMEKELDELKHLFGELLVHLEKYGNIGLSLTVKLFMDKHGEAVARMRDRKPEKGTF